LKRYIYLFRHGETDANKNDIYQGKRVNPPLNEKGKMQVRFLAEFMATNYPKISTVVFSPALRTLQTAIEVARCVNARIVVENNLHEIDHGDWEGKTSEEIGIEYPELSKKWWNGVNPLEIEFPNGEKIKDAIKRVRTAFFETLEKHQDEHLAISAHGGTNSIILGEILGAQNFRSIGQSNTALNIIRQKNGIFRVKLMNGTAHLLKSIKSTS